MGTEHVHLARLERRMQRNALFEHRKSRSDRDVVIDEQLDERVGGRASRRHRGDRRITESVGAFVRLLAGVELRVDEEAVLEIVDPERHRLRISDRAQMTGDLEMMPVRLVDRGFQLGATKVHVRLE